MSLDLSALADLEWLLRDERSPLDPERERAIGERVVRDAAVESAAARRRADDDAGFRRRLALAWLEAVRADRADLPGQWLGRGLTIAGWLLTLAGL
ncbi:MAG: hypothetical protein KDE27_03915, partial [Planctomycetes bacterium]|nr:hypothetical protein [Planctomycetota bacterium]